MKCAWPVSPIRFTATMSSPVGVEPAAIDLRVTRHWTEWHPRAIDLSWAVDHAHALHPAFSGPQHPEQQRGLSGAAGCPLLSRFVRTAFHLFRGSPQPRPNSPVNRKRIYSACGKVDEPAMVRKLAMTKQPREHCKN
jgi:hypothetical protein